MKKLVIVCTLLILLGSLAASLAGAFSYGHDEYQTFTTVRGEVVQIAVAGVYRYSLQTLVTSGIPWDFVRLLLGIPLLLVAFILHLRGSLRGTILLIGSLASFCYQYLLWTFDWAYNAWFLVYVLLFSLSLWTLVFVIAGINHAQVRAAIGAHFPVRILAGFSFAVAGLLLLKCLGEIIPTLGANTLPAGATGYYTLVDQALDLGLLMPFCIIVGILLLRRESFGYLLSASSLIILLSVGLAVIASEFMLGLATGRMNVAGIAIFVVFVVAALALLRAVLASIKQTSLNQSMAKNDDK